MSHHIARIGLDLATGGLYEAGKAAKGVLTPKIPMPAAPVVPTPEQEQKNENQSQLKAERAAAAGQTNTILTSGLGLSDTKSRKRRLGG